MKRNTQWITASLMAFVLTIAMLDTQAAEETLDNDKVIELVKLGLGESLVIDKIKASPCEFDVSIAGIKALKAANVPDNVISAMLGASKGAAVRQEEVAGEPNDPRTPRDAGIYLYEEADGKAKFTRIEPAVYTQQKSGVAIFAQYGQTAKQRAVLRPATATLRTANPKPVFYFYFENTKSGLGETANLATSPNEFVLAQFETKNKDNIRSLVVGQVNAYSGTQMGPEDKAVCPFDFERIAPGIFKVTPRQDLAGGEYGFFYGGNAVAGVYMTTAGGKVFDFGVDGSSFSEPSPKKKSRK